MMSFKQYNLETPEWIWSLWTRVINDNSEYSRYNDRLIACLARDLQRFDEEDLINLDDRDRERVEDILADAHPEEAIPALNGGDPPSDGDTPKGGAAPGEADEADRESRPAGSSPVKPRGERR
jgi:hypothetical protein